MLRELEFHSQNEVTDGIALTRHTHGLRLDASVANNRVMEFDLLVRNGVVVDGSGAERFRADVGIKNRKVTALISPAEAASATAPREIDATGLVIAPGFIDLHSHSDWVAPIPDHGQILKPFLMQGVTTFVGGNC